MIKAFDKDYEGITVYVRVTGKFDRFPIYGFTGAKTFRE
jgi:hypothetical protein